MLIQPKVLGYKQYTHMENIVAAKLAIFNITAILYLAFLWG